jgi:hypothetical protein
MRVYVTGPKQVSERWRLECAFSPGLTGSRLVCIRRRIHTTTSKTQIRQLSRLPSMGNNKPRKPTPSVYSVNPADHQYVKPRVYETVPHARPRVYSRSYVLNKVQPDTGYNACRRVVFAGASMIWTSPFMAGTSNAWEYYAYHRDKRTDTRTAFLQAALKQLSRGQALLRLPPGYAPPDPTPTFSPYNVTATGGEGVILVTFDLDEGGFIPIYISATPTGGVSLWWTRSLLLSDGRVHYASIFYPPPGTYTVGVHCCSGTTGAVPVSYPAIYGVEVSS